MKHIIAADEADPEKALMFWAGERLYNEWCDSCELRRVTVTHIVADDDTREFMVYSSGGTLWSAPLDAMKPLLGLA